MRYLVLNENALCYRIDRSYMVGVVAHSVLRGSNLDRLAGVTCIGAGDKVRLATLADFEAFRVSHAGIPAPLW